LLRGLKAHYPEFEYQIILSQPDPLHWAGPRGRVTDLIDEHLSAQDAEITEAYICGGRPMIEASRQRLLGLGFPEQTIHYERFF